MSPSLQDALSHLRRKSFDDIPTDDLKSYFHTTFQNADVIANSVPPPPHFSTLPASPSDSSSKPSSDPNPPSVPKPFENDEYKDLCSHWGKPLKVSAKDNPLNIPVYKMAGHDRHGAWFARRSIHRGLPFRRWKAYMKKEFETSMAVEGGPGEGAIRGIAADKRIAEEVVEGEGKLEVFQLSAVFPGPVAPREFVIMMVTGEDVLGKATERKTAEEQPEHYVVVSIPVEHPDAPPRDGLVRGFYESVEMIREVKIPVKESQQDRMSKSAIDLPTQTEKVEDTNRLAASTILHPASRSSDAVGQHAENYESAVEWIMITRSDPGGGIPRFMVERSTPASITQDAVKFLKWALKQQEEEAEEETMAKEGIPEEEREKRRSISRQKSVDVEANEGDYGPDAANGHLAGVASQGQGGIFGSIASAAQNAFDSYAPDAVRQGLEPWLPHHKTAGEEAADDDDESTETSSLGSFESAQQFNTAEEYQDRADNSSTSTPMAESLSSLQIGESGESRPEDDKHYKELVKLEKRRKELEKKFEEQRQKEFKKSEELNAKEAKEAEKAKEKHEKELKRQKEKHDKEMKRLAEKREKEAKKMAERQKRLADKDELGKAKRERDEFKQQVDVLQAENDVLRKQLGELQRENTLLVKELGKVEGGSSALRAVREDLAKSSGRDRASSAGSRASRKSTSKLSREMLASDESLGTPQAEVPATE